MRNALQLSQYISLNSNIEIHKCKELHIQLVLYVYL